MRTAAAVYRELIPDRRTDGELLAAFISERSEPAFIELVRRHGPLVWGACRRLLPDPADAEDAFQAAFLVLVRRAHQAARNGAVGPWLHRVAVWTARNARRKNARRLARQHALVEDAPLFAPDGDLRADIDGALLALPARYRDPIILCHLQGYSRREAAERLGCAEGTLSAWLNRGLAKLRTRLRDFDPTKVLPVLAAGAVPAALAASTARAAAVSTVAAVTVTPAVSSIVEGVLQMLWMKKATAASFALCAVFAMGVGVGLGTRPSYTGAVAQDGDPVIGVAVSPQNDPKPKPNAQPNPKANPQPKPSPAETLAAIEKQAQAAQAELQRLIELRKQIDSEISPTTAELEALQRYIARAKGREKPDEHAALEKMIREKEAQHRNALVGVEAATKKAEHYKAQQGVDPKALAEDKQAVERFQKNAEAKAAELKELKEKLGKLSKIEKPDVAKELKALKDEELALQNKLKLATDLKLKEEKLGVQKGAEKLAAANDTVALESMIRAKEAQHQAFLTALKSLGNSKLSDPNEAMALKGVVEQLQKSADASAAELKSLKDQLAKLKGAKPAQEQRTEKEIKEAKEKLQERNRDKELKEKDKELKEKLQERNRDKELKDKEINQDKALAEIQAQLERLVAEKQRLVAQSKATEKQIADAEAALREYQRKTQLMLAEKMLAEKRVAEASRKIVTGGGGYIELTIAGKAGAFEFTITEVPAGDSKARRLQAKFGPVSTRDPAALAVLLARAKKDSGGPQEVRVIAQPQTVLGAGPVAALEACDKAGYKTVKFTGYVFGGGFATELKSDQKGEVRGYKRYDGTEVRPKELAEEIQEGLRRL
ncbi:sigma-70 family rna polymerase sigma factor : RNA polymerase sigma factor, sigma-70 family OS=Singulisphaera acidiphila (strain ATCC BAA-1392 / DSM 18658 / VKM B-2454 / MOB10) GN=Sinac_0869 PE=4 SV=1: Sigma70_r2: Sigma70_r4_2 [Gemmata massiliana]|uniref:ECF RNA polymerase sigma factor SigE n=1 Tax=Gemmata massiliana TaxID=1210884 RepID=A0A6P2CQB4_9BACT|nr:sigma-70 family RNA polymerase sigma factor [Gemmata massiliana]VTR91218.1 sigma-70 family rna polymerase sigma factor : RNA polymerase sigma factor, sigma-70 family OS=Singulisphaera acidiphila (strain ATCC BAA-1392 / DSM 18658 / VKM B-2454 / MOB10) GN=Sinac_0869 PE=4 SV=1: Sigma70_r2: Sigma70_r4_2 [Gemmata massiliana]